MEEILTLELTGVIVGLNDLTVVGTHVGNSVANTVGPLEGEEVVGRGVLGWFVGKVLGSYEAMAEGAVLFNGTVGNTLGTTEGRGVLPKVGTELLNTVGN